MEVNNLTWTWQWHGLFTAFILILAILYGRGWDNGRRQHRRQTMRQPVLFYTGILLLFLIAASPLSFLGTQLFAMRVFQRIMLVALIPVLIMVSDPLPVLANGLPKRYQVTLSNLPQTHPQLWTVSQQLTRPAVAWFLFVIVFWSGYDPQFHQLTIRYEWLHSLGMAFLFLTASLYWWHILAVSPQFHEPMTPIIRIGYTLVGAIPVKLVGLILLFTTVTVYTYPASIQFKGLTLTDQSIGAMIHWSLGGIIFTWTGFYLVRKWLDQEEKKPHLSHSTWSTQENMLAPGLNKQSH